MPTFSYFDTKEALVERLLKLNKKIMDDDSEKEVEEGEIKLDEDLDMPLEGVDDFGLEDPEDHYH